MIGFKELLIILVVVLLVFGTKKLRSLGGDLGLAIKDFNKNIPEDIAEKHDQ
jgi:sec-independent protein translocase protein TatA